MDQPNKLCAMYPPHPRKGSGIPERRIPHGGFFCNAIFWTYEFWVLGTFLVPVWHRRGGGGRGRKNSVMEFLPERLRYYPFLCFLYATAGSCCCSLQEVHEELKTPFDMKKVRSTTVGRTVLVHLYSRRGVEPSY